MQFILLAACDACICINAAFLKLNCFTALFTGEYGLPDRPALVFCSFNKLTKADTEVVDMWAAALRLAPPTAVFWTLRFPAEAEPYIRAEFRARGIPDHRVIFHDLFDRSEHIRIKQLADLFLDSPAHNAHMTAADALWAGVPVLTASAEKISARIAASLVRAVDGDDTELVQPSYKSMEDKIIQLISKKQDVSAHFESESTHSGSTVTKVDSFDRPLYDVQRRVQSRRQLSPLFTKPEWVSDFEKMQRTTMEVWSSGQQAMHVELGRPASAGDSPMIDAQGAVEPSVAEESHKSAREQRADAQDEIVTLSRVMDTILSDVERAGSHAPWHR